MTEVFAKGEFVVGTKQTLKAIKSNKAKKVYIAEDANSYLKQMLEEAIKEAKVEVVSYPSMEKLGNDCAISCPAACAAVIE